MKKILLVLAIVLFSQTVDARLIFTPVSDVRISVSQISDYLDWYVNSRYLGETDWRLPTDEEIASWKKAPNADLWAVTSCLSKYPCLVAVGSGNHAGISEEQYFTTHYVVFVRGE